MDITILGLKITLVTENNVLINNNENTLFQDIICGVDQGSIIGLLLFILYINDLKNVSNALDFIIFADSTNVFISDKKSQYSFYQGKVRTAIK